ncbi:MAG TPA: hypothetical protein ENI31_01000 [Candidatus Omnitrophica bacterium]|nr:hypothetical protein [Candidatus Omnitrophota bacterium]
MALLVNDRNKHSSDSSVNHYVYKIESSMPKKGSLRARLRKAGIRHYDVLIHDQPKEWLIKNFSQGATDYPVNVARLMRNIVWQTRERIIKGEKPPLKELIRL